MEKLSAIIDVKINLLGYLKMHYLDNRYIIKEPNFGYKSINYIVRIVIKKNFLSLIY